MEKNIIEYKEEKFLVSFDPEDGIIFLKEWGGIDGKKAKKMKEKLTEFLEKIPPSKPIRLLVEDEKFVKVTPEARRIFFSLVKIAREKKVKIALVTSSPTIRVVARFIGFTMKDFNFFTTKEEGIKWLKEKK